MLMAASPAAIRDTPFVGRHNQLHAAERRGRGSRDARGAMAVAIYGPSGHRQERSGPTLPRSARQTRRCRGAHRPLLRKRIRAVQGARRSRSTTLSRYLGSIPLEQRRGLLPPDVSALTRVFPVLLQVDAVADARRDQDPSSVDPLRVRRRAFEALRALLAPAGGLAGRS